MNENVILLAQKCKKLIINNRILKHEVEEFRKILMIEKKCQRQGKKWIYCLKVNLSKLDFFLQTSLLLNVL